MLKFVFLIAGFSFGYCQQWGSLATLKNPADYFTSLLQETIYEVEDRSWSNFKLFDLTDTIHRQMYGWLVAGNLTYHNGYLVSIEHIDLSNIESFVTVTTAADNSSQVTASVRGILNMRNAKIGYDVTFVTADDEQHYTGTFVHTRIAFRFTIVKNLDTEEFTASYIVDTLTGGLGRMIYMPANEVTQVLSLQYVSGAIGDGVETWGVDLRQIILEIAKKNAVFPEVCFNYCTS